MRMLRLISHEIKIRIAKNKPFRAGGFEVDLDPCMCALPFTVQDHTVAELSVPHPLTQSNAELRGWSH